MAPQRHKPNPPGQRRPKISSTTTEENSGSSSSVSEYEGPAAKEMKRRTVEESRTRRVTRSQTNPDRNLGSLST